MEERIQKSYQKYHANAFQTLLHLYQGNYWRFAMSGLFFIIKHLPSWLMPIAIANVINAASSKDSSQLQAIYFNAFLMACLIGQNILTNYFHVKYHSTSIRQVEAGLRATLIKKIQELSIPYQKELQSGRIQSKIIRDVEAIQTLSSQVFVSGLNIAVNLFVALGITLYKSPVVFMFFLLTVPLAAFVTLFFRKRIRQSNSDFRQEMEETSAKVIEVIELAPIARAHGLEKHETTRLNKHFTQIYEKGFHLDILQSVFGSVSWASFQIFQLICLIFTGILALQGRIQPGDVETYHGKKKIQHLDGNFRFEDVSFHYPDSLKPIIDHFSLEVKAGETIAFVGPSGSGKSTLLNLLIGFIQPSSGRIFLDNQPLDELDMRSVRNYLAVVPQTTLLFSASIKENITYGLKNVSKERLDEVIEAAQLSSLIDQLPDGLDTLVGEHGNKLSGGQKQRTSIARALIRQPKIILLDEATSALDNQSEKKIQQALNYLTETPTTFIVAHRLSTIKEADKIVVIDEGKIVEIGTYEELLAQKGYFYRLKNE
ncbi:ABC transporter ATP-binding protein [Enterococcus faecium]|uniref:ABC transporter ATP-binding protein n=1 Tax=Enterococcus faecium TaxID=1352 RepID=UPI0010C02B6C|nr:ABC transporter ATP-binding protein [Enterococcus faecium]TKN43771.1 ABC transporter ATP-binding protein [Enterococcus faecium]TKO82580.1 ABC transporter ATP-binding protein [Enterococcus faecium]